MLFIRSSPDLPRRPVPAAEGEPQTNRDGTDEHRAELPTLPNDGGWDEDAPTRLHSLTPLASESEAEARVSGSLWRDVWRRRWLLAGAAAVAFCSMLSLGRVLRGAPKAHTPPPIRAVASYSVPEMAAPAVNLDPVEIDPTPVSPPPAPSAPADESQTTPAGPPKAHARSVVRAPKPVLAKKFMPNEI
jgi:hypothetical protein